MYVQWLCCYKLLKEKMVFAVFAFVYIIQRCVTIIYCLSQTDKRLPVCVLQRSHLPVNTWAVRVTQRPRCIKLAFERKSEKSNGNWFLTNQNRALSICVCFFWFAFKRKFYATGPKKGSRNGMGRGYLMEVTGSPWLLRGLHSAYWKDAT